VFCPHEANDLRPPSAGNLLWPETAPDSASTDTREGTGSEREEGMGIFGRGASGSGVGRPWNGPFAVHMGMGYVAVPLAAEPREVYNFISAFGHRALEAKRRRRERDEAMAQLVQQCRAQLRLRRLAVDWARVEPDQAQAAMIRLLRSSHALAPLMEGVSLCSPTGRASPMSGPGAVWMCMRRATRSGSTCIWSGTLTCPPCDRVANCVQRKESVEGRRNSARRHIALLAIIYLLEISLIRPLYE